MTGFISGQGDPSEGVYSCWFVDTEVTDSRRSQKYLIDFVKENWNVAFSSFSLKEVSGPEIQWFVSEIHKYAQIFFVVIFYWKWLYFILKNKI